MALAFAIIRDLAAVDDDKLTMNAARQTVDVGQVATKTTETCVPAAIQCMTSRKTTRNGYGSMSNEKSLSSMCWHVFRIFDALLEAF